MSRSIISRGVRAALVAAVGGVLSITSIAHAQSVPDYVTIVPGSLTQGTVKASLGAGTTYDSTSVNLGDWPLNTGTGGSSAFAISYENPDFNGNSFGGTPNTEMAFGNGGGVTLQFKTPITPVTGEKDIGIFTAQALLGGSGSYGLNGNMEATILVSSDDVNWFTLVGAKVSSSYVGALGDGTTYSLNAPTMAYNFGTGATAWNAGAAKLTAAQLAALPVANYTTPMPNDALFNNSASTNAQRLALTTDTSASDYAAVFGATGGGNWFEVDDSGLSQIDYIRLNGDADDPSTGGVRLDAVFANSNAVPEPTTLSLMTIVTAGLVKRRRRIT